MPDLSPPAVDAIRGGDYLRDQEVAPKPYKDGALEAARDTVLAVLASLDLVHLAMVVDEAWPVGSARYYVQSGTPHDNPVLYVAYAADDEELALLRANPRVSASIFLATGFERRREAKSLQIQGVTTVLGPGAECDRALKKLAARNASAVPDNSAVVVRIDGLAAVLFDAAGRPQWGFLDYARLASPQP